MPRRNAPRSHPSPADAREGFGPRPEQGWLRLLREQCGLSHADVARILGTSRQAYAQLESAEIRGAISLHSLARAAAALGGELVYSIRHDDGPAKRRPSRILRPVGMEPGPLAATSNAADEDDLPTHMR